MNQGPGDDSTRNVDLGLKATVFKACHLAVWSDDSMSSDERHYLSHLIEALGDTEAERSALRALRHQDVNKDLLIAEIEKLDKADKAYVLDTCIDVLASDRKINWDEINFLDDLQKTCQVDDKAYRAKLIEVRKTARIALSRRSRVLALLPIIVIVAVVGLFGYIRYYQTHADITLGERCSGKEIAVTVLPAGPPPTSTTMPGGQNIFDRVRGSIVSVTMSINHKPVSGGSGAVIGSDDSGVMYIVTNRHVIRSKYVSEGRKTDRVRIEVQQPSGAKFDATFDFYSRDHDLAILAVKGMGDHATALPLVLKADLQVGQPVSAVGSPIGLDHSLTAGVISALRDDYLQTDATIHSGSSGGPLIDARGAICGITTLVHETKDYGFALYADFIIEMLAERRKRMAN